MVAVVATQTNGEYFNVFLTDTNGCTKDKLTVADNSATGSTCGQSFVSGPAKSLKDGDVSFHFTTDGSGSGSGFMLTYKLIDKPVQSK